MSCFHSLVNGQNLNFKNVFLGKHSGFFNFTVDEIFFENITFLYFFYFYFYSYIIKGTLKYANSFTVLHVWQNYKTFILKILKPLNMNLFFSL